MSELYHRYKGGANIEFDDMLSIALVTTFELLKNYSYKKGFYLYWKKGVTHRLYDFIEQNSYQSTRVIQIANDEDFVGEFALSTDDTVNQVSAVLLNEQIRKILFDPINRFKMIDAEMYLLEIEKGYSIKQIANIYGISYHNARIKNERTRNRLKNILFNSKE